MKIKQNKDDKLKIDIASSIPFPLVVFDLDGKVCYSNSSELSGKSYPDFLTNKKKAPELKTLIEELNDNKTVSAFEGIFSKIEDSQGNLKRISFFKYSSGDSNFREVQSQLEQFFYIASHDLQEPLRTLKGVVELLEDHLDKSSDKKTKEYLGFIVQLSERMEQLILDLLSYSRIGNEKDLVLIDANEIVQNALKEIDHKITDANAEIKINKLPSITVYPEEFTLLVVNMLSNSLKYRRPDKNPEITIDARDDGNGWVFSFEDNGIGIEDKYYEQIFKVFKRLHSRKDYEGTGIGLAQCKRVIDRLGGKIWCESTPGTGTTFYIYLPKKEVNREA